MFGFSYYLLLPLARGTNGNGYSSSAPLLPTPLASDTGDVGKGLDIQISANGSYRKMNKDGKAWTARLSHVVYRMTPTTLEKPYLNPDWVEWLMGFPRKWTDINQGNPEIKYFNCSNYKGNRGTCQSTHYIRVDFLEEVVLGEIRRLTKFASLYEDDFLKAVIGHSQQADEADRKLKEKELKALLARDEELDGLFERIYEDNVSGKISDDRFSRMSRRYEDEQKELTEKIKQLRSEIEKQSSRTMTTDMFISLVRKYTRAKKLTPRMLNELVEKIEVFNAEKVNGVWEQRLRIHYNCVGTIEIPSALPLPTPDVSVNTRKGVVVNYAPCDVAI